MPTELTEGGSSEGETSQAARLKTALRWLRSHHRRLEIERRSAEERLRQVSAEVDRVAGEIDRAEERLRGLGEAPGGEGGPA